MSVATLPFPPGVNEYDVKPVLEFINHHKRTPITVLEVSEQTKIPRKRVEAVLSFFHKEQQILRRIDNIQYGRYRVAFPGGKAEQLNREQYEAPDKEGATPSVPALVKKDSSAEENRQTIHRARDKGITSGILEFLNAFPGSIPRECAEYLEIDPNHASATLKGLHDKTKVRREPAGMENGKPIRGYRYWLANDMRPSHRNGQVPSQPPANAPTLKEEPTKTEDKKLPALSGGKSETVLTAVKTATQDQEQQPNAQTEGGVVLRKTEIMALRSLFTRVREALNPFDIELVNELIPGLSLA